MEPIMLMAVALSSLAGVAMLTAATLAGWRGWLDLKRTELNQAAAGPAAGAGARIEIADLRERIRKLEAIAAGVDL